MKRGIKIYLALSFVFLAFGIFFVLNSVKGITGNAILEEYDAEDSTILAIVFLFGGILLMMQGVREIKRQIKEGELETAVLNVGLFLRKTTTFSKDREILPDTQFLRRYHEDNVEVRDEDSKEDNYRIGIDFGGYPVFITRKVISELTHIPMYKAAGLAPKSLVNYLERYSRAQLQVIDADTSEEDKERIFEIWKKHTNKGRKSNSQEEYKFKKSADIELLARAYSRGKRQTIILSDDSEIREASYELRRRGANVKVVGYDEVFKGSINFSL